MAGRPTLANRLVTAPHRTTFLSHFNFNWNTVEGILLKPKRTNGIIRSVSWKYLDRNKKEEGYRLEFSALSAEKKRELKKEGYDRNGGLKKGKKNDKGCKFSKVEPKEPRQKQSG
ncbi:unnamed protein product [Dovyalis caffra]|uniref:Uncharacterized protein n=1 Tax=Dovyalis caffra TaxID=77055 RepID=A0AAV1QYE3_9ROSI|nr:unnamed protein product [Dovyalis caffra]